MEPITTHSNSAGGVEVFLLFELIVASVQSSKMNVAECCQFRFLREKSAVDGTMLRRSINTSGGQCRIVQVAVRCETTEIDFAKALIAHCCVLLI